MAETRHAHPPYLLIWLYLFVLTVAEIALAFELPFSRNVKLTLLLHPLVGTALVAAGTNAFNQLRERDVDALMHRTAGRPLPSGRLTAGVAGAFAGVISIGGVVWLALFVNLTTAGLATLTLVS